VCFEINQAKNNLDKNIFLKLILDVAKYKCLNKDNIQ